MLKSEVKIGETYSATISGKRTQVRIIEEVTRRGYGSNSRDTTHWRALNVGTGREVEIKSAVKLSPVRGKPLGANGKPSSVSEAPKATPTQAKPVEAPSVVPSTPSRVSATLAKYAANPPGKEREGKDVSESRSFVASPIPLAMKPGEVTRKGLEKAVETKANFFEETNKAAASSLSSPAKPSLSQRLGVQNGSPAKKVGGKEPTEEQKAILEAVKAKHPVTVIEAGAGTGKTTTLRMIADVLTGNGQYTAFNKALVKDSASKFQGTRVACNTTHSLAFRSEGKKFAARLDGPRMRSEKVADLLRLEAFEVGGRTLGKGFLAAQVMGAIRRYCQSDDREIQASHFKYIDGIDMPDELGSRTYSNNQLVRDRLLPYAVRAWQDLTKVDGQLPYSGDYYVKVWQLNKPIIAGDYILLDEGQDTAPVMLDVLKQQGIPVIIVGDTAQQIYEWRGAVNALAAFGDVPTLMLSQSFRFGESIANLANAVLATLDEPVKLRLKGLPSIPSVIQPVEAPDCVLTRTNAVAVSTLLEGIASGKKPHLIGGGSDVIAFVEAAKSLMAKVPTSHPDLACFTSWDEVREYSKQDEGEDLRLMVKLIDGFTADKILDGLKNMSTEENADLTICTAHKSKGREWNKVRLAQDFPTKSRCSDSDRRLLYVAVTRAKLELDVSRCPFFTGQDALEFEEQIKAISPELAEAKSILPSTPNLPPSVTTFTWSSKDGKWLVRGPKGQQGKTVEVIRKDGSKQNKLLLKEVDSFSNCSLYSV